MPATVTLKRKETEQHVVMYGSQIRAGKRRRRRRRNNQTIKLKTCHGYSKEKVRRKCTKKYTCSGPNSERDGL
jgi:hypothetical protein